MLVFLWILFAFSYGNADYNIHLRKYTQYQFLNSQTEWLYNQLMVFFNRLGLSYRGFLIIVSAFIHYTAQTITLLLNTIACVALMELGASIHIVKLATSLIYLLRPIFLRVYVNQHYRLNRAITYTGEPIKQKWNGVAQHVASVILDGTDNIVLTIFSTLYRLQTAVLKRIEIFPLKTS